MTKPPFFSIISVTKNAAWQLKRTAQSVHEQSFKDYEYIIIDGGSSDETQSIINYWNKCELVQKTISEEDHGVYNAMNKGIKMAEGNYVLFLNANDIFATRNILQLVRDLLYGSSLDGLLGWGELNNQIWASWAESEGFKLSSLGFCHQSLYVRRELLVNYPFDERSFKTDSDTKQLGNLYAKGYKIPIIPKVLAIRGGDPGLSADKKRTAVSIYETIKTEYPFITEEEAKQIVSFRRRCIGPKVVHNLIDKYRQNKLKDFSKHLSFMVLDTLFLSQTRNINPDDLKILIEICLDIILDRVDGEKDLNRLIFTQNKRTEYMIARKTSRQHREKQISKLRKEEVKRIEIINNSNTRNEKQSLNDDKVIVSLSSTDAQLEAVSLSIQSLYEQTYKPHEIHLWIAADEIKGKKQIPNNLSKLEKQGLNIHLVNTNLDQYNAILHKSIFPSECPIVIAEENIIYPSDAIEHLIDGHKIYPDCVIANCCHQMIVTSEQKILPYVDWIHETHLPSPSFYLHPSTAGGVLYPPNFFSETMIYNKKVLLSLAPYSVAIWLNTCALAMERKTFATTLSQGSKWHIKNILNKQDQIASNPTACNILNDMQIKRCFEWLSHMSPKWTENFLSNQLV